MTIPGRPDRHANRAGFHGLETIRVHVLQRRKEPQSPSQLLDFLTWQARVGVGKEAYENEPALRELIQRYRQDTAG